MKRIRFFLLVALASALAGVGSSLMRPGTVSATEVEEANESIDAVAQNGNLYVNPNSVPRSVCICAQNAIDCAPCKSL
ncbi:MAG: hypothetical protein ABW277_14410 [Longimicrobiaceae bacterium]